jgi:hypothetical protein
MFSVLRERLLLRQFIVSDFAVKQAEFLRNVGEWMPSSTDWKRRPGRSWREGRNFGETLVKAATQGTDGLGSAGIFSKRSTAPPRCVMNSRRSPAARAPPAATPQPRRRAA